jgi:hypothetical protein
LTFTLWWSIIRTAEKSGRLERRTEDKMDLNAQFVTDHSQHFVESRLQSARAYRYGNGSPAAAMIASVAAGIRRMAATIERWARGANSDVVEYRLPRVKSAR